MVFDKTTNRGYILVSTIWVLAFLSIAAAAIGEWYGRSLSLAAARVDGARGRVEELSTRATLLYKIATAQVGRSGIFLESSEDRELEKGDGFGAVVRQGIPDIIFDGTPYLGYGEARFAIQDESGLWGLVPETPVRTRDLLLSQGVEYQLADVLASRLADYVDADDLVRINGAEATEYRFAGLAPPPNSRLESIFQLQGVLGWEEIDAIWKDDAFPAIVSLAWGGMPNPSMAPREVLLKMPGANAELVDKLLALRHGEGEPDGDLSEWLTRMQSGEALTAMPRPSYEMRMRFWLDGERQCREYSVKFSAGDQQPAPWIFENNHRRPLSRDLESESAKAAQLPAFVL